MKKYLVLTSVLALVACGGGSGGNGGDAIGRVKGTVSDDVIKSNKEVTGMLSEIGVAADGSTVNVGAAASRTATTLNTFTHNGKEYKSYKLDDVNFLLADEGFAPNSLKFTVNPDTGEITHFTILGDPDDAEDADKVFERIGTKEIDGKKYAHFKGIVEGQEAELTYVSRGKDLGLQYADFGTFPISLSPNWDPVFVGGYTGVAGIEKEQPKPEDNITFTGKAVGHVMAIRGEQGSGHAIALDGDAKLVFNQTDGAKLTADFGNWYDVSYDVATNQVTFSNPTGITHADFYLVDDKSGNGKTIDASGAQFYYFGKDNTPTEAVGAIQVRDCVPGKCIDEVDNGVAADEVRMNLGFGGIAK